MFSYPFIVTLVSFKKIVLNYMNVIKDKYENMWQIFQMVLKGFNFSHKAPHIIFLTKRDTLLSPSFPKITPLTNIDLKRTF